MRTLLSVKWKFILAVVGVTFISLIGLMIMNHREVRHFMLQGSRTLLADAGGLEASRYNLAAENVSTVMSALDSSLQAELDQAVRNNTPADPTRLSAFAKSALGNSRFYLKGLGIVLNPDVFLLGAEHDHFRNSDGFTIIKYSNTSGTAILDRPEDLQYIMQADWWKDAPTRKHGLIAEPFLNAHNLPQGEIDHVETRFVQSVYRDGRFLGVIWAEMCLSDFQQRLQAADAKNKTSHGVLVSPEGATVGRPKGIDVSEVIKPSSTDLSTLDQTFHPELMAAVRSNTPYSGTMRLGAGDRLVQVTAQPIVRLDIDRYWFILVFRSEDDALAASSDSLGRQLKQGLVMLLVSGLLGYLAAKMMGRSLVTNEEWHRTILDRVPLPLGLLDEKSEWVYANPAIAAALASSPGNMIGKTARETMSPKGAAFVELTNDPKSKDIENMEITVLDGRHHDVSSCRLLDTDGNYIGRLIIGVDVTDTKNIERTLSLATSIARSLDGKSGKIMGAAQNLSDSAMEKSAAIEEITSTTQRIGESSLTYAKSAKNSFSQAEATHNAAGKGATEAQEASQAMSGVRDSGQKIRKIIKLIDDIAFQTNLLSLNAAVEAARAGRNGKGFAVVAEEVRSLAGRSARAAKETSAMIEEMTGRIGDAAKSIDQLGGTLVEIRANAENLRENSNEVAKLADQQTQSVQQVHVSLEQISKSVDSTIVISQETASSAESIMQQAAALRQVTEMGHTAPSSATRRQALPEGATHGQSLESGFHDRTALPYEEQP